MAAREATRSVSGGAHGWRCTLAAAVAGPTRRMASHTAGAMEAAGVEVEEEEEEEEEAASRSRSSRSSLPEARTCTRARVRRVRYLHMPEATGSQLTVAEGQGAGASP